MLVKDKTKYCWVDGEVAGEPKVVLKMLLQITWNISVTILI